MPHVILDSLHDNILASTEVPNDHVMKDVKGVGVVDTHKATHLHVLMNWFLELRQGMPSHES